MNDQAAIVLAAGRGTRMGTPKALMSVAGRPWWRTQTQRLTDIGVPQVWVVSDEVRASMDESIDALLVGGDSTAPMFSSILAGARALAEAPPRGVFVLPVDVPAPRPDVWTMLASAGHDAAAPTFESRRGHPVWLSWAFVESRVLRADPSARLDALVAGCIHEIAVADPDTTANLNTPDDLQSWSDRSLDRI